MDSTENSIENESFEIFENFEVLNRVWEIESFFEAIQIIHFRSRMSILLFRILNLSHVITYNNEINTFGGFLVGFLVRLSLVRKQSFF